MQAERIVPLHLIDEDAAVPYLLEQLTLIREKRIIDIGGDPVARASRGRCEREKLSHEGVELKLQCMIGKAGARLRCRYPRSDACGDGEPVKTFRSAAHEQIRGDLGGEIEAVGVSIHRECIDGTIQLAVRLG